MFWLSVLKNIKLHRSGNGPGNGCSEVTDRLISAGVKAIFNCSPRVLRVPADVVLRNVDLSVNLEVLSFNLGFGSGR